MTKPHGILETGELVDLLVAEAEADPNTCIEISGTHYSLYSICPHGRHWINSHDAPWNAPDPERPEDVAEEDWRPEPIDRDPANYETEDGEPMLWEIPKIVPLIKIEKPTDTETHTHEPILVWFADRVERQWTAVPIPPDELAARARKTWPTAAAFLDEFSMPELAAISLSTDPTIAALRLLLASWPKDVWSDDARIVMGLDTLVSAGIIDATRSAEITAK